MKLFSLLVALVVLSGTAHAAPTYKADKKIGEGMFKSPVTYLAAGGEMIYAIEQNGDVHAFGMKSGERMDHFSTGLSNTEAIAVNAQGEIYVFATSTRQEERTYNNRKYTVDVPIGVTCRAFDRDGNVLRELKLDCLKSAKAAKFVGDRMVVADLGQSSLVFIDPASGTKTSEVSSGLRLCCGIFDFCVGPDSDTVSIANLGAFQVQQYDMNGSKVHEFGKRGKSFDEFQGCCNPVSVGYLADGSIVTVEKDPTRIKIYDSKGEKARAIDGIEELVRGCSAIPVAIDDEDNVFLAAGHKGYIVKCVPKS